MKNRPLCSGCLIIFLLMSFCIITGRAEFLRGLRPSVLEQKIEEKSHVRLTGYVYDIDEKEKYQILYLKNNSIIYQNKSLKESKIILYDEGKLNIKIGNQVEASGEISFYERERNPGNFDQKLYYQKMGISASVWTSNLSILNEDADEFRNWMYEFRNLWKEKLSDVMGKEKGSILAAVLLGEKSGMDEGTKELYQANGISHVLAISGLHLSIIGVGLYKIFRRLSGSYLLGGSAGISFLILYILMIGMSVSVLRALIMFLFRVGADMTGRHYDSPTALAVAALITVVWKPLYLYDGGFWLSYGAILGIILVLPMFDGFFFQSFWASISINLVTIPVLLYCFYEISLCSVFLNMIVIPLMTVVLLSGFSGSVCCLLGDSAGIENVGEGMLCICKIVFEVYEKICKACLGIPYVRIVTGQPKVWQMIVYYVCLLMIIMLWRYRRQCKKLWLRGMRICSFILVIIMCTMLFPVEGSKVVSVTVLDVSQGDGIFIRGPRGNTYFIDGGSSDEKQVGKYRIEPFLKSQGVGKLDYVFISHGDSDHISGIIEMIERKYIGVSIETIVLTNEEAWNDNLVELARIALENGIQVVTISKGQKLTEGKMVLSCLAPQDEFAKKISDDESNAASMVLALNYGEFDMLFTGDVEKEGEELLTEELTEKYESIKWDVLKVAHHGSKNSTSEKFLDEVRPTYACISAGRENSYGHPHTETIKRLEDADSKILSTQDYGAITVKTDGQKMSVEGYTQQHTQ